MQSAINWGDVFHVVFFGITMVFTILVLLVFTVTGMGRILAPKIQILRQKVQKNAAHHKNENGNGNGNGNGVVEYEEEHLTANQSAAIGMALHLFYAEVHDDESDIITIKTVEKRYSPWNSKIYGLNNIR